MSVSSQTIADWTSIQILETFIDSMNFIKTLVSAAVSSVMDFKNMLPEESYSKHSFIDMKYDVLKWQCVRNKDAHFVSTSVTNAFSAMDKKYLRKLALCFYINEYHVNKLIEFHIFEFKYYNEDVTKELCLENRYFPRITKQEALEKVKERAEYFIKAWMAVAQMCQDTLPKNYGISIQLSYNDNASECYQAPGFHSGADHVALKYHETVKLAGVKTPFHRLVARSYKLDKSYNLDTDDDKVYLVLARVVFGYT